MSGPRLEFDNTDGVVVARLFGEVDVSNAESVRAQVEAAVPNDALGLVLDCSGLRYLDSAGVRACFAIARRLAECRQRMGLLVPEGSTLHSLVSITKMDAVAIVCGSLDDCIDALREPAVD